MELYGIGSRELRFHVCRHMRTPANQCKSPRTNYEPEGREFESLRAHHSSPAPFLSPTFRKKPRKMGRPAFARTCVLCSRGKLTLESWHAAFSLVLPPYKEQNHGTVVAVPLIACQNFRHIWACKDEINFHSHLPMRSSDDI